MVNIVVANPTHDTTSQLVPQERGFRLLSLVQLEQAANTYSTGMNSDIPMPPNVICPLGRGSAGKEDE